MAGARNGQARTAAIDHHDLSQWAASNDIVTAPQVQDG
jgi:hypothetical protein